MNGSGCKTCPIQNCDANYRGSRCAALRDMHGLGDPMTNADRIRAMSDEELADRLDCPYCMEPDLCNSEQHCNDCILEWLKEPVKEDAEC